MAIATESKLLTTEMLERFNERAPGYDETNTFFQEDFDELVKAGYLLATVPTELGGRGMTLADFSLEQRRLAYYAPATALGVNMHHYWVGLAADLWNSGDKSLEWMLTETMNGAVFAAGHAESGL
ncbi:MAG: acyl-CoA/acyl-ACP dehydrogenase, partial [Chloroflexi bacterium]|nr:acyl-CoA/acyl-ACP dehydrogenase [Chloroflexota bacterium]